MKHEQPEHFVETDIEQMLKNARQDRIKRLLQDIGFIARRQDDCAMKENHD